MMVLQELHEHDWANRVNCAQNLLEIVADDEAHFHLSGCVNKQYFRYWSDENPRQLHERPLHSERVTVGSFTVIGSYFFQEEGHAVTANSGRCVHMLHKFLAPEINRRGIN
jgi:hypothetical protein